MVNKITLIGNVGNLKGVKQSGDVTFQNISVATSESYKDKNGEWQEKTEWHNCTLFGKMAERQISKGDTVYIEGKLKYRKGQKDGVEVTYSGISVNYIKTLKKSANAQQNNNGGRQPESANSGNGQNYKQTQQQGDDLPF